MFFKAYHETPQQLKGGGFGGNGRIFSRVHKNTAGLAISFSITYGRCVNREHVSRHRAFWLHSGDILIQRANSLDYVGVAAIYDGPEQTYIYPDLMMRIRVESNLVGKWIWRYLRTSEACSYFMSNATGTAGNMPKINGATVRRMLIPTPPSEARMKAALNNLECNLRMIDAVANEVLRGAELIDRIDRATLAKAFKGELVSMSDSVQT